MSVTTRALLLLLLVSCGKRDHAAAPQSPAAAPAVQTPVPAPARRTAEDEARQVTAPDPEEPMDRLTLTVSVAEDTPDAAAVAKAIRRTILIGRSAIRGCFDARLAVEPALTGKLVATWTIAPGGQVPSSSISETTFMNDAIEECVLAKLGHLEFANPGAAPIQTTLRLELGR